MCAHPLLTLYTTCLHLGPTPTVGPGYLPPIYCGRIRAQIDFYHTQPDRDPEPEPLPAPRACPPIWGDAYYKGNVIVTLEERSCGECAKKGSVRRQETEDGSEQGEKSVRQDLQQEERGNTFERARSSVSTSALHSGTVSSPVHSPLLSYSSSLPAPTPPSSPFATSLPPDSRGVFFGSIRHLPPLTEDCTRFDVEKARRNGWAMMRDWEDDRMEMWQDREGYMGFGMREADMRSSLWEGRPGGWIPPWAGQKRKGKAEHGAINGSGRGKMDGRKVYDDGGGKERMEYRGREHYPRVYPPFPSTATNARRPFVPHHQRLTNGFYHAGFPRRDEREISPAMRVHRW